MRRTILGSSMIIGGLCLLLAGLLFWNGPSAAAVHAQTQPPPRPTLTPMPAPKPTAHSQSPSASATGRITGTVIDRTTGAPAPGIAVTVGDTTVTTDANGNYDRNGLPDGSYPVALALTAGQGTPDQASVTVVLAQGATIIQHLFFHSLQLATPLPTPATKPAALPKTGAATDNSWLVIALGLGILVLGLSMRFRRTAAR